MYTGATVDAVERVGIRELRNHVAEVVRRAGTGERILVTVDGRPVAQLGPIEPAGTATLEDLAARGLVVLARRADRPAPAGPVPLWPGARLGRLVRDVRGS